MDLVSGTLFDGKRFRALTLIDTFTREGSAPGSGPNFDF